ncbi:MAG: hypothetical protein ACD_79C01242G0003 [uncultured bacterium]|nr:MAG: hypothetical protein ACD_79C01242G0003 [uncultured bacterium]
MNINDLISKAKQIRNEVLNVAIKNGAGHIAPSLSCLEILIVLYYKHLNYDFNNPFWEDRDRVIFSKAHGCYALYAILSDKKIIPSDEWKYFYTDKSTLSGCIERRIEYGLEAGCGSLGHGLPLAVGLAYGAKVQNKQFHTYCIIGDGEMQEGTTWESIQFCVKHEINNLTIIIDRNKLQAMDFISGILDVTEKDIISKLKGFGVNPVECNGNDLKDLINAFSNKRSHKLPQVICAQTIKGYGIRCMENIPKFHFRIPTVEELQINNSH